MESPGCDVGWSVVDWTSVAGEAARTGSVLGRVGSDERTPNDLGCVLEGVPCGSRDEVVPRLC